jgi:FkbM family methyltransferase
MIKGLCHLVADAARRPSLRAVAGDRWSIDRLLDRPRWQACVVRIGGRHIHSIDALSTFHQWADLFRDGVLDFQAEGPAPLIVDAGANVGLATCAWQGAFPRPEIIALGPCSAAFACLERNVGGRPGTTLLRKALWSVAGPVPFREVEDDSSHSLPADVPADCGTVEAVTLGSLLVGRGRDIDLLKVDIEGAEVDVLEEAAPHLPRVRRLLVEYHPFPERRLRLSELLGLIEAAGFGSVVDSRRRGRRTFDRRAEAAPLLFTADIYAERAAAS